MNKPPRFIVAWRKGGELFLKDHTSKPTALGHVRGLKRDPNITAIAVHPVEEEK